MVIAVVMACLLVGDRKGHGFPIGWGRVLEKMAIEGTVYAWGPCVLAMLYFQLHQIVYQRVQTLSCGVTLLQVWAFEHIAICQPIAER